MPCFQLIFSFPIIISVYRVPTAINIEVINIIEASIYTGFIMATIPKTKAELATNEPKTFPKAIS